MAFSQPNLLWIFCDQLRYQALSCNGDPNIQTPNIDRLAAEGFAVPTPTATTQFVFLFGPVWLPANIQPAVMYLTMEISSIRNIALLLILSVLPDTEPPMLANGIWLGSAGSIWCRRPVGPEKITGCTQIIEVGLKIGLASICPITSIAPFIVMENRLSP